jgi:hypothetical protein
MALYGPRPCRLLRRGERARRRGDGAPPRGGAGHGREIHSYNKVMPLSAHLQRRVLNHSYGRYYIVGRVPMGVGA